MLAAVRRRGWAQSIGEREAGVASVSITVPNAPSLVALVIYSQALLAAYPNSLRLSNVVRDVIQ